MARFGSKAADGISCPVTGDRGGPLPSIANQPSIALRSYVCPSEAITGSRIWTCTSAKDSVEIIKLKFGACSTLQKVLDYVIWPLSQATLQS